MGALIAAAVLIALLVWLLGGKRPANRVAPEDDVETPIDRTELEAAERELKADQGGRPLRDDADDDDDWGPGRA